MINLKELFNNVDLWIRKNDPEKIKLINKASGLAYRSGELNDTMMWYHNINDLSDENKKIIFGDIVLSLEDIKNRMLQYLGEKSGSFEDEDYSDYDDCGHSSEIGYQKVIDYFEDFNEERLISIAAGSTRDYYEVDIDGGRSYFMSHSDIALYIFNYLYYTKKYDLTKFQDLIYNSNSTEDDIVRYYPNNIYLPNEEEFAKLYNAKFIQNYKSVFENYNHQIKNLINNFKNEPLLADLISQITDLQADDTYILAKIRETKLDKIV